MSAMAWRRWVGRTAMGGLLAMAWLPPMAGAQLVVVPNSLETTEGVGNNGYPFNCAAFESPSVRYQQVYLGTEVGSGRIRALRFRLDEAASAFGPAVIPEVTIALSSTVGGPDALSPTFADNIGLDVATVFAGDLTLSSAAGGPAPRPFDIELPLDSPFDFDGTLGANLLLDVTVPTCALSEQFDASFALDDSVSRVFAENAAALVADFTDSAGLVTAFDLVIFADGFETGNTAAWAVTVTDLP